MIVIVSSTGIRNGLSVSRVGVGMNASTASISFRTAGSPISLWSPSSAFTADPTMIGQSSPGNSYLESSSRTSSSTSSISSGSSTMVRLVQEHDDRRHPDLARQQDVLARLGHRAVGGRDHQDRPVHLRRAGDHVLDVVGVAGAVHVRVVARAGLVLDVRGVDGDAALPLLGGRVDVGVGARLRPARSWPERS